jgi:hypothetical protein
VSHLSSLLKCVESKAKQQAISLQKKKGAKQAIYHEPIGQSYTTESSKWATHTRSWEELNNELSDKLLATLNLSEQGLSKTTATAIAARSPESKPTQIPDARHETNNRENRVGCQLLLIYPKKP